MTEDTAAYGAAVEIIDDPAGGTPIPDATWAAVAREAAIERRGGQRFYLDSERRLWEESDVDDGVQLLHLMRGGDVLPLPVVEEFHGPLTVLVPLGDTDA